MSNNTNTWNEVCTTWNTTCFNWAPCIAEVAEIIEGGARNPYDTEQELYDYQYKQPEKQKRLVQIYIKCYEKKFNKTINFDVKFGALWFCPCLLRPSDNVWCSRRASVRTFLLLFHLVR
jgi:hypothetical protein